MKLRTLVVALAVAIASGTAFASSCPRHMKAIDAALPKAKLSAKEMAEVKKLRADGERFHKAGRHAESVKALTRAEQMLGL